MQLEKRDSMLIEHARYSGEHSLPFHFRRLRWSISQVVYKNVKFMHLGHVRNDQFVMIESFCFKLSKGSFRKENIAVKT